MSDLDEARRLVTAAGGIVSLDARAVRASVAVVSRAGDDDLARATPCDDWNLAQLLAHMAAQHDGFAAAAAGNGADLSVWRARPPSADPVADYAAAADRVLRAFGADGVLARQFNLPVIAPGAMSPAQMSIGFHFIDQVVHGWDVARWRPSPLLEAAVAGPPDRWS